MSKKKTLVGILFIFVIILTIVVFSYIKLTKKEEVIELEFEDQKTKILEDLYEKYKDEVILNLTEKKGNFTLGVESEEMTYIAIKEMDPERCGLLGASDDRDFCFKNFYFVKAIKRKNSQECYNIEVEDRKKTCLSLFGKESCSSIENEEERVFCHGFVKNKEEILSLNLPCEKLEQDIPGFAKGVCELFKKAIKS